MFLQLRNERETNLLKNNSLVSVLTFDGVKLNILNGLCKCFLSYYQFGKHFSCFAAVLCGFWVILCRFCVSVADWPFFTVLQWPRKRIFLASFEGRFVKTINTWLLIRVWKSVFTHSKIPCWVWLSEWSNTLILNNLKSVCGAKQSQGNTTNPS